MLSNKVSLLIIGAMSFVGTYADNVGFTTERAVGEKISLAVGGEAEAVVRWADGSTDKLGQAGTPIELTLKSQTFTVESTGVLRYVYAPDAGLTSINTDDATLLERLYLPNNKLASLKFDKLPNLKTLDIQGNQFKSLSLSGKCQGLQELNCSYNEIKSLMLGSKSSLVSLICAGNELTSLSLGSMPKLQQLWCQGNNIENLNLKYVTQTQALYAFNNALTSVEGLGEKMNRVWLDGNKLTQIDLSECKKLKEAALDHNNLHEVVLGTNSSGNRQTLDYFYANDNALSFNSFPTVSSLEAVVLVPQADYVWESAPLLNEKFDYTKPFVRNAWNSMTRYSITWHDATTGKALVKDTDYEQTGGRVTFFKEYPSIYAEAVAETFYPGITIRTAPFAVRDAVGIGQIEESSIGIFTEKGRLVVDTDKQIRLQVYSTAGVKVIDELVPSGRCSYSLEKGIYLVDGKKVIVP